VKVSGAYWKGDSTRPLLQRVYGIAFPKKELLKEWLTLQVRHGFHCHPSVCLIVKGLICFKTASAQ
jgi:hypothetical protein